DMRDRHWHPLVPGYRFAHPGTYANGTAILAGPVPGHRLQIDAAHSRARAARRLDLLDDLVARRIDHDDVVGLLVADKHQLSIVGGRHGCKPAPREERKRADFPYA